LPADPGASKGAKGKHGKAKAGGKAKGKKH